MRTNIETMRTDGVKKNFFFQFIYQFLILVIPFVISPYLTRTLGETSLGTYTYTNSIAYYFVILCGLGIVKHGQRIIASRRNDDIALRKTFWSLFSVHAIVSCVGFAAYLLFCFLNTSDDRNVYFAQSLYVLSALFDLTWLFYGIERFRFVVVRNALVKIAELVLIFTLVRDSGDLLIYTLIMGGAMLLSQFCLLPTAFKLVKPISFSFADAKEHIKPLFILAVSVVAVSLYTVFDNTLLGLLSTKEDVAFYEYANKIIVLPKTFISIVGTVLFPRACKCIADHDEEGSKKYYRYSLFAVYFMGFGAAFGLIAVADLFALVYYGEAFAVCGNIIKAMTPLVLIMGLGDIFRMQYLIPLRKDISYTVCILVNAAINIALSMVLIPRIGIYGAIIGTLCAEVFGLIYQGFLVRKYIDFRKTFVAALPFFFCGLLMFGVVIAVQLFANASALDLCLQILAGGASYVGSLSVWFLCLSSDRAVYRKICRDLLRKVPFLKKRSSGNLENRRDDRENGADRAQSADGSDKKE